MSLYDFIDTNGTKAVDNNTAEEVRINGTYIKDIVPEYTTLYVKGREGISIEINDIDDGINDGRRYKGRRHNGRSLVVGYKMEASSASAFRTAYNKLNGILQAEQAKFIFDDEPDKYFTGTVSDIEIPDGGSNCVTGEFTIYCADPYKYSVDVTTLQLHRDTVVESNYAGTRKAYPTFETYFSDNCGYIAYKADDAVIEFGDASQPRVDTTKTNIVEDGTRDGTSAWNPFSSGMPRTDLTRGGTWATADGHLTLTGATAGQGNGLFKSFSTTGAFRAVCDGSFKAQSTIFGLLMQGGFSGFYAGNVYLNGSKISYVKFEDVASYVIQFKDGALSFEVAFKSGADQKTRRVLSSFGMSAVVLGSITEGAFSAEDNLFDNVYHELLGTGTITRNTFVAGDTLKVENGRVFLNGVEDFSIGNVRNDFDAMFIKEGSTVGVYYSDWSGSEFTDISWQEVYI